MRQFIFIAALASLFSTHTWAFDGIEVERLIDKGEYIKALTLIEKAQKLPPYDELHAAFLQAVIYNRLGKYDEAIAVYERLLKRFPNSPEIYNNLAALYSEQGDHQGAELALQSALETNPSYDTVYKNLSNLYKALASIAYNRALSLDSDNENTIPAKIKLKPIEILSTPNTNSSAVNETSIEPAIKSWAMAWSNQDPESYLSSYSADFLPSGLTYQAWQSLRRERITSPQKIKVEVSNLVTTQLDDHIASATFTQYYESDQFSETTNKLLLLRNEGGRWRILQEIETK